MQYTYSENYTLETIPEEHKKDIIISTNDEEIIKEAQNKNINFVQRSEKLSDDYASMRDVLQDLIKNQNIPKEEDLLMLYLTYPKRTWEDIEGALEFYKSNNCSSMLCRIPLLESPFLCMIEDGMKGRQIIKHDLYRRQDYPKCFRISHYVAIFKSGEVRKLNKNLYNNETYYYKIQDKLDIDELEDLEKLK